MYKSFFVCALMPVFAFAGEVAVKKNLLQSASGKVYYVQGQQEEQDELIADELIQERLSRTLRPKKGRALSPEGARKLTLMR